MAEGQAQLLAQIGRCRHCIDRPEGRPLPHEPRPVLRIGPAAVVAVCGQAPGTRVHASGVPFADASGVRLRAWMGVSEAEFYDVSRIAVVPMGFCFPGQDCNGGDLPPRRECASLWRSRVFETMPRLRLVLLIGHYAQIWHLGRPPAGGLTETVIDWRRYYEPAAPRTYIPLPHPSWRNNGWLKRNSWFEAELLPVMRNRIRELLQT